MRLLPRQRQLTLCCRSTGSTGSDRGIEIARASRRIAVESVVAGIGLSVAGMIAAA